MLPRWAESYVPPTEITQFFAPAIALLALVVEVLWIGGSILEPNDGDLRKQKDQILHGE
jgi:hypothetical protein